MLSKMMKKKKKNDYTMDYAQMNGYFRGGADNACDKWGIDTNHMGDMGFFDLDEIAKNIEKSVDDFSKQYIPESIKKEIDKGLKREADKAAADLKAKAAGVASNLLKQQAADPENQDKAIASTVNAGAQKVTQVSQDVADAFRSGGIGEVYKRYPMPFYIAGGLVGLITLKWGLNQVGAGKAKAVLKASNPRKKKRK